MNMRDKNPPHKTTCQRFIPRRTKNEQYRVQRGVKVSIPLAVKEHIERTEREKNEAEERALAYSALTAKLSI